MNKYLDMALLLTFIVMLSSCNNPIIKNELGKWVMCKVTYNGTNINYNVCPKVEFARDNQGKITFANGDVNSFTYIILSDNKIEFSFKGDSYPFNEKEYFYKTYEDDKFENLELFSEDKESRFFLVREKK